MSGAAWRRPDSEEAPDGPCAIPKLAPVCERCGCKIVGHGIEAQGTFCCCGHCAREQGITAVADHAP